MTNANKLKQWRENRNLTKPSGEIVKMLQEEVNEVEVEVLLKDTNETLAELSDIIIIATNEISLMGYDSEKVVSEKIAAISSRNQCPIQKEVWDNWQPAGKWNKDRTQDKSTLYVANYEGCKL